MPAIAHPLTGNVAYTASAFRKTVNSIITPTDGTAFGSIQGIRQGAPTPLVIIDGVTLTIHPHAGILNPFTGEGAYTYAITDNTTLRIQSLTQNYKIALALSDPSVGRGSTPKLEATVYPYSTSNMSIPGLVIAEVKSGTVSDVAPRLSMQCMITVQTKEQLATLNVAEGQEALVSSTNEAFRYTGNTWEHNLNYRLAPVDVIETARYGYIRSNGMLAGSAAGKVVTITVNGSNSATSSTGVVIGTVKAEYRPAVEQRGLFGVQNGSWGIIRITTAGEVMIQHMYSSSQSLTWSSFMQTITYVAA